MKTLSPVMSERLTNSHGSESVCIVEVQWAVDGQWHQYADKDIPGSNIEGKILSVSTMESVVKMDSQGRSQGISMELADSDGTLKHIINYNDVHGRPCRIFQWMEGIPLAEKFLLFEGEITSPTIWKEGSRSLHFEVITKLADKEIGFSPEEGDFTYIPEDLIGKAWPLVFGMCQNVPAVALQEVPIAETAESLGVIDPYIDERLNELNRYGDSMGSTAYINIASRDEMMDLMNEAKDYAEVAAAAVIKSTSDTNAWLALVQARRAIINNIRKTITLSEEGSDISTLKAELIDAWESINLAIDGYNLAAEALQHNTETYQYWANLYDQRYASYQMLAAAVMDALAASVHPDGGDSDFMNSRSELDEERAALEAVKEQQEEYQASEFKVVNGAFFPQNEYIELRIDHIVVGGQFDGDTFTITKRVVTDFSSGLADAYGFTFLQAGSRIRVNSNIHVTYIANILPSAVHHVKAFKTINGLERLMTVPSSYYTVRHVDLVGYTVTSITLDQPLNFYDSEWADDIYVTQTSPVGPNTVDIMTWMIDKYTDLSWDTTSFNYVKAMIENYPSNFALFDRMNIMQALEEIAFQARCAVWISDNTFFIKYLAEQLSEVDTVTESDIAVETMEVITTRAEELVTKFVAQWTDDYAKDKPYDLVLRHNVKKYGLHERTFDFYIYNFGELVLKSATFWLIRKANIWKQIRFKTYLHKLYLESFDTVKFDFNQNFIADSDVAALVTDVTYDSASMELQVEAWVPVRSGEMEPYIYAWPSQIDPANYFPTDEEIASGFAGGDGPGVEVEGGSTIVDNQMSDWYERNSGISGGYGGGGAGGGSGGGGGSTGSARAGGGTNHDSGDLKPSDIDDVKPEGKYYAGDPSDGDRPPNSIYPGRGDYSEATEPIDETSLPGYSEGELTHAQYIAMVQEALDAVGGGGSGATYPGRIASGSGSLYAVDIYKNGIGGETETVTAYQVQIAGGVDLPVGTGVMVSKQTWMVDDVAQTQYTMQVAVWI